MNVIILHYHLNTGGVTKVILDHLKGLSFLPKKKSISRVLIITGPTEIPDELKKENVKFNYNFNIIQIPSLSYSTEKTNYNNLVLEIAKSVWKEWGNIQPDILHIHNHHLAKNNSILHAIQSILKTDSKLLLQIHDFPEDSRPDNYTKLKNSLNVDNEQLSEYLYPSKWTASFAVLNTRDKNILELSGISSKRIHLLPNAVSIQKSKNINPEKSQKKIKSILKKKNLKTSYSNFFTYPVRGIRRKNLGEILLLSLVNPDCNFFAITLPPKNPIELKSYNFWKKHAKSLKLPVIFGLGTEKGLDFQEILESSKAIITTSLCEGFGFTFCEPWLLNKEVIGRDLPEITSDFKSDGIEFQKFYKSLKIPIRICKKKNLENKIKNSLKTYLKAYGLSAKDISASQFVEKKISGNFVDFGDLDEELQLNVIEKIHSSKIIRDEFIEANKSFMLKSGILDSQAEDKKLIQSNKKIISKEYSVKKTGERLYDTYRICTDSGFIKSRKFKLKSIVLNFLYPENFRLIRTTLED